MWLWYTTAHAELHVAVLYDWCIWLLHMAAACGCGIRLLHMAAAYGCGIRLLHVAVVTIAVATIAVVTIAVYDCCEGTAVLLYPAAKGPPEWVDLHRKTPGIPGHTNGETKW